MAKYELKTKVNEEDVLAFLNAIEPESRRIDSLTINEIMIELTGEQPKMWGKSIIGYGKYTYTYASGQSGDWMAIGFSPRKQSLTLYIMPGFKHYEDMLATLGKYKTGKSCLYIKNLSDVDIDVLKSMIKQSYEFMIHKYPTL